MMKTINAQPLFSVQNNLGEGPLWHPFEKQLYWVDITAGDLYRGSPDFSTFTCTHFDTTLGAFAFRKDGGMLLATGKGFAQWDGGQEAPKILWNPLPPRAEVRLNDGKVDPAGRFWAGSIDTTQLDGKLYRLDPDGSQHTLLHDVGIANGLGWSTDRKTMYWTDSHQATIFAFDYDLATGTIRNQRPFVVRQQDDNAIVPDGLCVDAEGCVWSAQWNGWEVVRYDPQGEPILRVSVPAQRVTACCFGGEKYDQLLITTARTGLTDQALAEQPGAGDIFICQTDTQGQETNFFG